MYVFGLILATVRGVLILCLVALHGAAVALLPEQSWRARAKVIQSFGRTLTWALGIKIHREGEPSRESAILVSTHRSYADIPVLAGINPVVFLAKAELAGWPVIGWAARKARTVFVDRHDPESRERSRLTLRERLAEGLSVLVFSEGTTSERGTLLPLKPGMFHEAASANLPIQVVYLEFGEDADSWVSGSVGEHFYVRFSRWRTYVKVVYRERLIRAQEGEDMPGKRMCAEATAWLESEITREVGEVREGNELYLEEQRQRALQRQQSHQQSRGEDPRHDSDSAS